MIELSSTVNHQASTACYIKGEHDPAGGLGAPLILGSVTSSHNNSKQYYIQDADHMQQDNPGAAAVYDDSEKYFV